MKIQKAKNDLILGLNLALNLKRQWIDYRRPRIAIDFLLWMKKKVKISLALLMTNLISDLNIVQK